MTDLSRESEDEYIGTPLLEGATTLMLIGGNEVGREILIEAHRLGLESIVVADHQYAPAVHLGHRAHIINLDDSEALRAVLRRELPDIVIQDAGSTNPDLIQNAVDGIDCSIIPSPSISIHLQDTMSLLEELGNARVALAPFASTSDAKELEDSCESVGYPCTIGGFESRSMHSPTLVRRRQDIDSAKSRLPQLGSAPRLLIRKLVPHDLVATVFAVTGASDGGETNLISPPLGVLGTDGIPHIAWAPLWTVDEHTRMTASPFSGYGGPLHRREEGQFGDFLWESEWNGRYVPADVIREVENRLRDYSGRVIARLSELAGHTFSGVLQLNYDVVLRSRDTGNRPEAFLRDVSAFPNEASMLTTMIQQPSTPACTLRLALGIGIKNVSRTASGAMHLIIARRSSGWAPAFFNVKAGMKQEGTTIQLYGKHRFSEKEPVGIAAALDEDHLKAREKALLTAHTLEEGIDYGQ